MSSITIHSAESKDKSEWNQYVEKHPEASAYHRFEWLEAVKDAYAHKHYALIARAGSDNVIVGVLPLIAISPPLKKAYLCSLPFCDIGACIADEPSITEQLRSKSIELCEELNFGKFEFRDFERTALDHERTTEIPDGQKVRMLMALPQNSDALLKSFKSKLRSQINKAKKNGLTFAVSQSSELVEEFYDVFKRNMRSLGSPVHAQSWFEAIMNRFGDNAVMSIVYYNQTPVGGGIILRNGSRYCIPWASTRSEYNHLSPNMLLYWSLLSFAADHGGEQFDFGRSSMNEGTYRFKKQWGAQPAELSWSIFEDGCQRPDSNTSKKGAARQLVESIWPKIPLSITVLVGSAIRRYISL